MFAQNLINYGRKPNVIRDLSAYAGARKAQIGPENVFDFSIGSPNVPPPPEVHAAMLDLIENADPVAIHSYTPAPGLMSLRQTMWTPRASSSPPGPPGPSPWPSKV